MIDAQRRNRGGDAEGCARCGREQTALVQEGTGPHRTLHLLASAQQSEVVRTRLGFTPTEEEVRPGESWTDDWVVAVEIGQ